MTYNCIIDSFVFSVGVTTVYPFNVICYPGGEIEAYPSEKIETDDVIVIELYHTSPIDLCVYNAITDACSAIGAIIVPIFPFLPYGRNDRRFHNFTSSFGRGLLTSISGLALSSCFEKVVSLDIHGAETPDYIVDVPATQYILSAISSVASNRCGGINIVYPDAGARSRYKLDLTSYRGHYVMSISNTSIINVIQYAGEKKRASDGSIVKTSSINIENDYPILVIDDICDGGATFIRLAEEIKKGPRQGMYLYVTHGIFSKGVEVLNQHYNGIFTTNSTHWMRNIGRYPDRHTNVVVMDCIPHLKKEAFVANKLR